MRCEDFEARLQEVLDERRAPSDDPELTKHAGECSACHDFEAGLSGAIRWLAAEPMPTTTPDLTARVVAALRADEGKVSLPYTSSRRRAPWILAATAAALMLACYPFWSRLFRSHEGAPRGSAEVAVVDPTTAGPEPASEVAGIAPAATNEGKATETSQRIPSLRELAEEQRNSYSQLMHETAQSWNGALALASAFGEEPASTPTAETDREWLRDVGDGFKPLSESTLGTLDALRSIVPLEDRRS